MAKALIKAAYGKEPDRSYMVGCSNGGRVAMVTATRYPDSSTATWWVPGDQPAAGVVAHI